MGEPSKLVRIPVLGGESSRALVPVGDGLSAILAGDTPRLKVFGGGWNTVQVLWAVRSLRCLAFHRQPMSKVTRQNSTLRKARTHIGGGEGGREEDGDEG